MTKRIYIENNYLIIANNIDLNDDKRNVINNIYVEINNDLYLFYKKSNDELIESIYFSDILDIDGNAYSSKEFFTKLIQLATTSNDVSIQDSTAPLMIVKSNKLIAETTLTSATSIDDYIINVADATGFVVGQYLTIYNQAQNRVYFSNIIAINTLAITLDTPLDFEFPIGSFVSVGSTNMNVDGSITPQIFGIRNPTGVDVPLEFDITRLIFHCLTTSTNDLSKFGDITGGLTNGIVIRRVDGTYRNILNAKTNGDLKGFMYDFDIQVVSGNQQDGFTGRITFAGQDKMGAVIRIGANEDLQVVIQDDLSTLVVFEVIAEGSEVTN